MWANRTDRDRCGAGRNDRTSRCKVVSGRPGRSRYNKSVGAISGDIVGAHPTVDVDDPGKSRFINNYIIQGCACAYLIAISKHAPVKHHTLKGFEFALHNALECRYGFFKRK